MTRHSLRGAAALALSVVVACATEPSGNDPEGTAQLRMLNAVTSAASLDLVSGGSTLVSGVGFEQASGLTSVPAGTQTLGVRLSGQSVNLATKQVSLQPGKKYSLVVGGSLASLSLLESEVSDTGLARSDRANIRIINIAEDFPQNPIDSTKLPPPLLVDVYITPPGVSLASALSRLSINARYSSYSTLLYFDVGSWVVSFTAGGTLSVLAATAPIAISGGEVKAVTLQKNADGSYRTTVVTEESP